MKEIEFTIDSETGELTSAVHGVPGPSCGDIAKILSELAGEPTTDEKTGDWYVTSRVRQQVKR